MKQEEGCNVKMEVGRWGGGGGGWGGRGRGGAIPPTGYPAEIRISPIS